jgi:hypothetical protein
MDRLVAMSAISGPSRVGRLNVFRQDAEPEQPTRNAAQYWPLQQPDYQRRPQPPAALERWADDAILHDKLGGLIDTGGEKSPL